MSWLDDLLNETSEAESPTQYIYWAGLSAISAVIKNRIWIEKGYYRLYPNIYVMLIGASGLRKGFPVSVAKSLVEAVDVTRVVAGRISIQGLLKELSTARTEENGRVHSDACAFLVSGEFASYLIEDNAAIYILTDLHDTHAHEKGWTNTLAGENRRHLDFPCLTFLGGSNQINLAETLPKSAHGGGLIARTFLVYADKKARINSLVFSKERKDYSHLKEYLRQIACLSGPFKWGDKVDIYYDDWYNKMQYKLEEDNVEDPTGTFNRIHDQILKVGMLISLAESTDMILEQRHIDQAIKDAYDCIPAMKQLMLTNGVGTVINDQTKLVIGKLMKSPEYEMARKKMLSTGYGNYDCFELDRIIETMVQAEWVDVRQNGKDKIYRLKKNAVEFFGNGKVN